VDQLANVDVVLSLLEIKIWSPARNNFSLYIYNNQLLSEHSTAGDRTINLFPGTVHARGRRFLNNFHHTTAQKQVQTYKYALDF
jgi:hypothetical protein